MRICLKERKALVIATAVAEEIQNNLMEGRDFLSPQSKKWFFRPTLMEYSSKDIGICTIKVRFFFEDGIEVFVYMIDDGCYNSDKQKQDWGVLSVTVRYFDPDKTFEKTSKELNHFQLKLLRKKRPWHHPRICKEKK